MSRRLIVTRQAELELSKAVIWYEEKSPGLGRRFIAAVRSKQKQIVERPESFPIDYRYARRALVDVFPYAIHFVVAEDQLTVIAILHTRQSKRRLRGRLP